MEKANGDVVWNGIKIKSLGGNKISIMDKEYGLTPDIQNCFTKTYLTTELMNNYAKTTVFDIAEKTDFYCITQENGLNSSRMKDALFELPKTTAKIRNPTSAIPPTENKEFDEESDDLQCESIEKSIIPSNSNDIYTRLAVLLGLKLSGYIDTLTESSTLMDEIQKKWNTKRTTIPECSS